MRDESRYRLLYFTYFAAFSGLGTFRNVFLEEIGMTGFEMGIIGALLTLTGTVAQPVWGVVTDWKGIQREVLAVAALVTGVAVLTYPLGAVLSDPLVVLAVGTVVFSVFRAPMTPVLDSLVLSTGTMYGKVRAFGSVAFGLGSLAYGLLIPYLGTPVIFYVYSLGMAVFAAVSWGVPKRGGSPIDVVGTDALRLLRKPDFAVLLVSAFLVGVTLLSGNDFFSVYMREIGASDSTTGLAWLILTAVEALTFVYAFRLNPRYKVLLVVGALLYAFKYSVYFVTTSPVVVLASSLVAGASFGAYYLAAVNLANELAPDSLKSTAQTLLWASVFGFGAGAGQLVAGRLYDAVGVQEMYAYLAAIAALAGLVGLLVRSQNRGSG